MSEAAKGEQSPVHVALQAAGVTAGAGLLVGGTVGILRSKTPVLWALATTGQWGVLGGTYWGMRNALLQTVPQDQRTPSNRLRASSLAGGASFAVVGAITRGRANVLPGTFMGTLFGYFGQWIYDSIDGRHTEAIAKPQRPSLMEVITTSEWSPVKKISDEDYAKILSEQMLKINAEIAVLDDDIAELKAEQVKEQKNPASAKRD